MKENDYYVEIESWIKRNEFNKKKRILEDNSDTLRSNWEIGKIIVEAQGGKDRAKYGNELIKKWSILYTKNFGSGYSASNLMRFRQFYLAFPISAPLVRISWSHIIKLLPIKDINKRNYYINLCIERNLSKRQLLEEIKSKSYERLVDKPEKIDIITMKKEYQITDEMKNPIIIKVDKNKIIKSEKDLELTIMLEIEYILTQLGKGFCFIGSQVKIKNYFIDILLFNIELNNYVVVELKMEKLKVEDKAQIQKYMKLVDEILKKSMHNNTMGIIISKEQNDFVVNIVKSEKVVPLTYELETINN